MSKETKETSSDLSAAESMAIPRRMLGSVQRELNTVDVVLEVFKKHKVLFKTSDQTERLPKAYLLKEHMFFTCYRAYCQQNMIKPAESAAIDIAFNTLVKTGKIIPYNEKTHNSPAFFGNETTKSLPFSYLEINRILRGAEIRNNEIIFDNIKNDKAKARIYLLNASPKQLLIDAIEKLTVKFMTAEMAAKAGFSSDIVQAILTDDPSTYMEDFKSQQSFFASYQQVNLRTFTKDMIMYLEGRYERYCDKCKNRVFTPMKQSSAATTPVPESKPVTPPPAFEEAKEQPTITSEYPEAGLSFPAEEVFEGMVRKTSPEAPAPSKNPKSTEQKNEPAESLRLDLSMNGGLIGIPGLLEIDPLIHMNTRISHYYSENERTFTSTKSARSLNEIINDLPALTNIDQDQYNQIQREIEDKLRCKCGRILVKPGFFNPDRFVSQFSDAVEEGTPPVFVGYPGDGKSTMAESMLRYVAWRYGVPFEVYMVSEATTSGKLLGRLNITAMARADKNDTAAMLYGIVSLCLFKRGFKNVGLGSNLMLDEFNRADFKHIAFFMSFLASPYRFRIDDDNFRSVEYPNRRGNVNWMLVCTMNTQDINNEAISIAAKSRFAFINVDYKDEEKRQIIMKQFHVRDINHPIVTYLMELSDMTMSLKEDSLIRFPAGVRHLVRIHEVMVKAWNYRTTPLKMTLANILRVGPLESETMDLNIYGSTIKTDDAALMDVLDNVVKTNLLNVIWDENSQTKKEQVKDSWNSKNSDSEFLKKVRKAIEKS